MQKLVEQLGLTFHVCINRDAPVRLKGMYTGFCLINCIEIWLLTSMKSAKIRVIFSQPDLILLQARQQ